MEPFPSMRRLEDLKAMASWAVYLLIILGVSIVSGFHSSTRSLGGPVYGLKKTSSPSEMEEGEVDLLHHHPSYITFVSSNKHKIQEVETILGTDFPLKIRSHSVDLSELQATPVEISRNKCKQAAKLLQGPVIVEDTSLCFNALNGLPGPYIKWFYEAIGNDGLARMLQDFDDKSAYAQCVLSYTLGVDQEVHTFVGVAEGSIVPPRPGPTAGFGWDPIFQPLGLTRTFAEMSKEEKNKMSHRFKALREFKSFLKIRLAG